MFTEVRSIARRVAPLRPAFILPGYGLLVVGLVGCFGEDPSEPPFPPLRLEELAGCWKRDLQGDTCHVRCFDHVGGYYSISRFKNPFPEMREDSGSYTLSGNDITLKYRLKTTQGTNSPIGGVLSYTIVSGKLRSIEGSNFSGVNYSRVHPDSFPCGMKPWVQFSKPVGWPNFE